MRGPEWNGDAAARYRRQRSMGIGEFPQQAENRFRVTKALLAEECRIINIDDQNSVKYNAFTRIYLDETTKLWHH